jgi:ABC-type multidrug transport system fused ATPase/permease subunit
MTSAAIYRPALALLAPERGLAAALAGAGIVLAVIQLAEPVLFGRMIDALAGGRGAFRLIALWAALGLFGIVAGAVVAIAHRLSTVAGADLILVLDHGRIVERGSFRALADGDGLFARLVAEGGFTESKTADAEAALRSTRCSPQFP